jgi:putative tryptophan/tyrosine transport system substrate-binding protein
MTKMISLALCAMLFVLCSFADAQQSGRIPRIGYIESTGSPGNPGPSVEAFRQGLRDLGYIEGKNIQIEYRFLEGKRDRIPSVVAELVQLKVDVLIPEAPPVVRAAKQATKTIPIVIVTSQDPVAAGYVASLARPGGNITGVTRLTRDLSGKRLELLKEVVPRMSRIGLLSVTGPDVRGNALREYEAAARALKIPFQPLEVGVVVNPDLDGAFRTAAKGRVNAFVTSRNFVLVPYRKKIADLAIKNRLPSMYELKSYVEAGGLMSYTADDDESFRRAAAYVDKILKGANPAELPIEQPTKFEFAINLKTAKALNLTIPQSVLFRADKVIK